MSDCQYRNTTSRLSCFVFLLLCCYTALPQFVVRGKVTTQEGAPLAAATIFEKGKTASAISKEDGAFMITVSSGSAVLIASYVGYQTRAVAVNNQKYVAIILNPTPVNLDDLVVIGYGTARKKTLPGQSHLYRRKILIKAFLHLPICYYKERYPVYK